MKKALFFAMIGIYSLGFANSSSRNMKFSDFLNKIISAYENGFESVKALSTTTNVRSNYYIDDDLMKSKISPEGAEESFFDDFTDSYVYYAYFGQSKNYTVDLSPKYVLMKTYIQAYMKANGDFRKIKSDDMSTVYKSSYCEVELNIYENSNLGTGIYCLSFSVDNF